jgi:hypothetical protein
MITKAFAPMPFRNLEMFLCVCAHYSLALQILRSQRIRELQDQNLRHQQLSLMSYMYIPRSSSWSKARIAIVVVASVPREDSALGYNRANLQSAGTSM